MSAVVEEENVSVPTVSSGSAQESCCSWRCCVSKS